MDEPAPVANSSTPLTTLVESGMQSSKTSVVNLGRDLEKAKSEDNSRFTLKGIMVMVACTSAWIISVSPECAYIFLDREFMLSAYTELECGHDGHPFACYGPGPQYSSS